LTKDELSEGQKPNKNLLYDQYETPHE